MTFTRLSIPQQAKSPLSLTLSPVLPDHLSHAKVGGAPPKHSPNRVSVTHIGACLAVAPVVVAFFHDKSRMWGHPTCLDHHICPGSEGGCGQGRTLHPPTPKLIASCLVPQVNISTHSWPHPSLFGSSFRAKPTLSPALVLPHHAPFLPFP